MISEKYGYNGYKAFGKPWQIPVPTLSQLCNRVHLICETKWKGIWNTGNNWIQTIPVCSLLSIKYVIETSE